MTDCLFVTAGPGWRRGPNNHLNRPIPLWSTLPQVPDGRDGGLGWIEGLRYGQITTQEGEWTKLGQVGEHLSGSWSYWRVRKGETRVMAAGFRLNSIYTLSNTGRTLSAASPGFGAPGAGLLAFKKVKPFPLYKASSQSCLSRAAPPEVSWVEAGGAEGRDRVCLWTSSTHYSTGLS